LFSQTLSRFPVFAKIFITGFIFLVGLGYFYSIFNVYLSAGITYEKVAAKYYGNETSRRYFGQHSYTKSNSPKAQETEEAVSINDIAEATEPLLPIPTLKELVSLIHVHIMGHASLFFIVGFLFLFTSLPAPAKAFMATLPLVFVFMEGFFYLATRFMAKFFALGIIACGFLMAASSAILFLIILFELWIKPVCRANREV
jgi:hypothetical protein